MKTLHNLKFAPLAMALSILTVPTLASSAEPKGQVRGYYSHGSLSHSTALSMEGPGYIHLFQDRDRHFGSEGLIQLIETSAQTFQAQEPSSERLQIGDIAAENGGEISGHASHQNGLDIDLVYFRRDRREQSLKVLHGFDESFVTSEGGITPNFDTERNWTFLKILFQSGRLNRIFVDPGIKRAFCALNNPSDPDSVEMLRRLRPYPNHADHWHVRLTCPPTSANCKAQAVVPPGDGCKSIDADFANANKD